MIRMPFGKYKGWVLADMPDEYLDWLLSIDLRDPLLTAVEEELSDRESPVGLGRTTMSMCNLLEKLWIAGTKDWRWNGTPTKVAMYAPCRN